MFIIVRLIIVFVFLGCSALIIKKSNTEHKHKLRLAFAGVSVALVAVLPFLPFENLFMNFDSPEEAYEYYIFGKSNIELVVEGNDCDLVVDRKSDVDSYLIIPKNEDGWKIGIGSDTKNILQRFSNGVDVCIYQYKNTGDYFITILDTSGGELNVSDEFDTKFYSLTKSNDFTGQAFTTYYAHLDNFDPQYYVTVNGNKIVLEN